MRVAHGIALSFDAAWDPLLWMVAGHELYLLPDDIRADVALMDQAIADNVLELAADYTLVEDSIAAAMEWHFSPEIAYAGDTDFDITSSIADPLRSGDAFPMSGTRAISGRTDTLARTIRTAASRMKQAALG